MQKFNTTFAFVIALCMLSFSQAQTDNCLAVEGFEADLAYTSELFPGKCAQFALGTDYFYYQAKAGKSAQKIKWADKQDRSFVLQLVEEKTVKKAVDALFLVDAIEHWAEKRILIIEEQYAARIYSSAELEAFPYKMEESGLGIHILEKGDGPLPEAGKSVSVHYRGYLLDGNIFDESYKRGQAFSFPLGRGRVIKGWDEGIAQLPVGTHALLKIPAEMGYGARGQGSIPPNSTLVFDVFVKGN